MKAFDPIKRAIIINPAAGAGKGLKGLSAITKAFGKVLEPPNILIPHDRADTIAATRTALRQGANQIIAVGGDGTANAVANGFFDESANPIAPDASLAIAPFGTGSDYYRTLAGKRRQFWFNTLFNFDLRTVDLGMIQTQGQRPETIYFLNLASLGLTTAILKTKSQRVRRWPHSLSYLVATLMTAPQFTPVEVHLSFNQHEYRLTLLALTVAKGIFAGGGMRLGGQVSLDDGLLDLTLISPLAYSKILAHIGCLYSGEFSKIEEISKHITSELTILGLEGLALECDGELLAQAPLTISVKHRALKLCVPRR